MSTVLVTGGNGFVGRHVVRALLDRGDRVRVFAPPGEDTTWLEEREVAVFRGDVRWLPHLARATSGADAVLHLAAMMDVWRPIADYRAVNVAGTENVCRVAMAHGVRRVVHMSSASVYGFGLARPADEGCPLAPFRDPYPLTKAEGDLLVQQMIRDQGLQAVIVRPDQIFGPGDHLHFGRMADRLLSKRGFVVGSGDNAVNLVYVADAVRGLLLALDHEQAAGQIYNITHDHPLTQNQLLDAIAREIGASPPRLHAPYAALYAAGYLAQSGAALIPRSRRPPITRLGVAFLGTNSRCSIEKARRELAFSPEVDIREGVRLAAAWYREQRRPLQGSAPTQGRTTSKVQRALRAAGMASREHRAQRAREQGAREHRAQEVSSGRHVEAGR